MKKALVFSLVTTLAGLVGCSANPDGSYGAPAESSETTSEALGSCYGASCTGKDPNATGCNNDSYAVGCKAIVDSSGVQIGRVALRYSPSCHAGWGRTVTYVTDGSIHAYVGTPSSPFLESGQATGSFTSVSSPMYNASQSLVATGSIIKLNGNGFGASTPSTYAPSAAQVNCQ